MAKVRSGIGAVHGCSLNVCFLIFLSVISFVKTTDSQIIEPKMSASFVPDHKASMVLFLDRVYGIDNQDFLLHVLEVGFLPDMRAAASLDTVSLFVFYKPSKNNKITRDFTYVTIKNLPL